ncbi:hypothetical protein [Pedobacter africanus]|uniref:Uncharacterized protein n=1 Tax=Pedobacter africanus TaxID=151894 RepID=A0A1W2CXZ6_9SPHI|nr:hypothetical protein [Pedobacter africanus]SMC89764.1 hypothetical protein SAMN04488524_3358 [Pedobacter africanus]
METTAIKNTGIKVREVYLSDLTAVMNLYLNGSADELTADFGLPIGLAEQNGRIIACSFVNINSNGQLTFRINMDSCVETCCLGEDLNDFTVNRFTRIWGPAAGTVSATQPLKNAVKKLVDWLNHCS